MRGLRGNKKVGGGRGDRGEGREGMVEQPKAGGEE